MYGTSFPMPNYHYRGNSVQATIKNGNKAVAKYWDTSLEKQYGSWQRLDLGVNVNEVTNPDDLIYTFDLYGGVGQIYLPILYTKHGNLNDGYAQMLHIYPDDHIFSDGGKPTTYGGVKIWRETNNWESDSAVHKRFTVNMTGILEELQNEGELKAKISDHIQQVGKTNSQFPPHSAHNTIYWSKKNAYSGEKLCSMSSENNLSSSTEFKESMKKYWKIIKFIWDKAN